MRKMILWAVTSLLCMSATMASATSKEEMKCNYVVKNLHLKKEKAAAFRTVCLEYIKEHKAANDAYDNLKDKLKSKMKNGSLTESEANQLLNAHWNADAAEVTVRRKYTETFKRLIGAKKTLEAFDYVNDSMKKVKGENKKKDKDDDDE